MRDFFKLFNATTVIYFLVFDIGARATGLTKKNSTAKHSAVLVKNTKQWDNLWIRQGGSKVNGVPRKVPKSTRCTH